jgi:hypothetical protein
MIRKAAKKSAASKAASKATIPDLALIRLDGGTQPRDAIDGAIVGEYADAIRDGAKFPPVTVFYDGQAYWLADGFHRHQAHGLAGKKKIPVELHRGTRRDAILHSVGANEAHGLRRTNEDKRRAVLTLLNDAEWSKWSDGEIANRCAVSREYVNRLRPTVTCDQVTSERTYTTKHGTVATMQTAAIGKGAPDSVEPTEQSGDADISAALASQNGGAQAKTITSPQQAEFDRQRDETLAKLPQAIKDREQAKAEWRARANEGKAAEEAIDRAAELEEAVRVLEAEVEELRAENKLYGDMKVQFTQGGFEKVIAGKDEEIRVLQTQVATESADKVSWMRSARLWERRAKELGWSNRATIDIETSEIVDG